MSESALVPHKQSALDVYGEGDDIKKLAARIKMCLPGGNRLNEAEVLSLSQLSVAYNLNPFNGEVWYIPGKGTMVGIKGHRKAARKQAQYWTEHILLTAAERKDLGIPDDAIAYKCMVYRSDLIRQSAEAVKMMYDAGMKDAAEKYAYKPTVGVGYWTRGDSTKMKPDQVARKRAEAEALKVAFDLPFASEVGNGDRVGYIDADEWEVLPAPVDHTTGEIIDDEWDDATFDAGEDEEDEPPLVQRPPEPKVEEDPADDNGINSPKALLAAANEATMGYYNAIPHMLHAIRKTTGDEHWNWPVGDTGAYLEAYQILVDYAKAQKESAS